MSRARRGTVSALAGVLIPAAAVLLAGCPPRPLPPAMTLRQVVEKVNENNELLPWFKARMHTVQVQVPAEGSPLPVTESFFGFLIYSQPDHFYLDCKKAVEPVMGMGSDAHRFWFWIGPGVHRCWVGSHQRAGAGPDGAVPMHPRQLTQLLGVDAIPEELTALPMPVLRVNDAQRAHVIEFVDLVDQRPVLVRELWVDRDTNLPRRVRLFNTEGVAVIESELNDWRRARGSAAWFPHDVLIRWLAPPSPDARERILPAGSRLRLKFIEVEVTSRFSPANKAALYEFTPERVPAGIPITVIGPRRTPEPPAGGKP